MDLHADPFVFLTTQLLTQTVTYFVVVSALFVVIWRWGAKRFEARRIQKVRRVDAKQIRYEVKHTLVALLFGGGTAGAVVVLYQGGHTKLATEGWSAPEVALFVVGLVLFNDAWFYFWHRLLHHPKLFKHVHAVHHRSIDTSPFTSYSFHAVEALLLGGWVIPMALLVPMPVAALGAAQGIGLANNVMSHLGYEFLPPWLLRVPGLRWMNTATFHGLHHARSHGNYGLFTRLWDRLLGTELDGYEEAFTTRAGGVADTRSR